MDGNLNKMCFKLIIFMMNTNRIVKRHSNFMENLVLDN